MAIKYIKGNIFNSKCQTIVNTVNCVGVIGKGIGLVHKLRYPQMHMEYKELCKRKLINKGFLWLYKEEENVPWILCFPTKYHWSFPNNIEWIEEGLQKFIKIYEEEDITSVAFPLPGINNGRLYINEVKRIIEHYLSKCPINTEIYEFDPTSNDDLFVSFKNKWLSLEENIIKLETGIQLQYARKISEIIRNGKVNSMIALVKYDGIGEKTIEKAFNYILNRSK